MNQIYLIKQKRVTPAQPPAVFSSSGELKKEVGEAIQEMEQGKLVSYEEIKKILDQYIRP